MQPIVGTDFGKRICHVHIRNEVGAEPIEFTAPRAETASKILEILPDNPLAMIAMERTGGLELPILQALENTPHMLAIAQNTDERALRTLLRSRGKTDRLDAKLICHLIDLHLTLSQSDLVETYLIEWQRVRAVVQPREDVRFYQALIRHKTAIKNRLKATTTEIHRQTLTEQLALRKTQIAAPVSRMTTHLPLQAQLLTTIPTITPRRTIIILLAAVGDVRNLPCRNHLVSYFGLKPPKRSQTGGKEFGKPKVTKGLDLLHSELHMISLKVASRPTNADRLGQTFLRMKARQNGHTALWAVKRHLIRICYGVLASGQPYRPGARSADSS
jgi:transposase